MNSHFVGFFQRVPGTFITIVAVVLAWALLSSSAKAQTHPASTLVALGGHERKILFFDAGSGKLLATIRATPGPHNCAVSPDGRTAIVSNWPGPGTLHTLSVVDLRQRKIVRTISLGANKNPAAIKFLSDGRSVQVVMAGSKTLLTVDIENDRLVRTVQLGETLSYPHLLSLSEDEQRAYIASAYDGKLILVDNREGSVKKVVKAGSDAQGLAVHPTRNEVWIADMKNWSLNVFDARDLSLIKRIRCDKLPGSLMFDPSGRFAIVACVGADTVLAVDVVKKTIAKRVALTSSAQASTRSAVSLKSGLGIWPWALAVDPFRKIAYVSCLGEKEKTIRTISLDSWKQESSIKTSIPAYSLCLSTIIKR